MKQKIAIQGIAGSFSHLASLKTFPDAEIKFCITFEEAFQLATKNPDINLLCPCENTVAGRVPEFHSLLRRYSLQIYEEYFEKISHNLLAVKGAKLGSTIKKVHSHIHALGQCRKIIIEKKLKEVIESDTAFSAKYVSEKKDKSESAIGSDLAAKIYNLEIIKSNVEDEPGANITRFLLLGKDSKHPEFVEKSNFITSCVFQLKSIPSALYKALGSFSGYGINLCRLESFALKNTFQQVAFYIEIEKHIEDPIMQKALEELGFHTQELNILGCYKASSYRSAK
jgi:prephenate dehydratase